MCGVRIRVLCGVEREDGLWDDFTFAEHAVGFILVCFGRSRDCAFVVYMPHGEGPPGSADLRRVHLIGLLHTLGSGYDMN